MAPETSVLDTLRRRYWSAAPRERDALSDSVREKRADWRQQLRLLHLLTADLAETSAPDPEIRRKIFLLAGALAKPPSPYAPRMGNLFLAWGDASVLRNARSGLLRNAGVTHLGAVEVLRSGGAAAPPMVDFVPFDDLRGVLFSPPASYREVKLYWEDGRDEIAWCPANYALSTATDLSPSESGSNIAGAKQLMITSGDHREMAPLDDVVEMSFPARACAADGRRR